MTICKSWSFISFPWGLGALYGCFLSICVCFADFFLVFLCLFVITCACSWSSMSLWGYFVALYRCFCPSLCCLCFPVSFVVILRSSAVILYLFVVDLLVFAVAMYWFLVIFCLSLLLFWFQQFVAPLYSSCCVSLWSVCVFALILCHPGRDAQQVHSVREYTREYIT